MKKKVLISIIVVLSIAFAMLLVYKIYSPKASEGLKQITINVDHLVGEDKTFNIQTDADFLRAALEDNNLVTGSESEYGLWVEAIDGEFADPTNEEWWGYLVNGEMANFGVDEQVVCDGDVYEFTLYVGYENYN